MLALLLHPSALGQAAVLSATNYIGMADASGGVALGTNLFVAVNDEDSVLRIYRRDAGGLPVKRIDASAFLELVPGKSETDFEAATRVGDRIYWISSHGRNVSGKGRINRHRFFATDIKQNGDGFDLVPAGRPYNRLLFDLAEAPQLASLKLGEASLRAPKTPGGLNIEGLCGTPDGHLLIGFRNPIPRDRALLVPLTNPGQIINGYPAKFGEPILLDLGGRGIRDIARWNDTYIIIGGAFDGHRNSRLFEWSGGDAEPAQVAGLHFKGFNPEGLIVYPDTGLSAVQIVSDDGTHETGGVPGKRLPESQRRFRSMTVDLSD